ncbi:LLM class flavin-dependent oxidoreductase [Granulicella mallensis]|uniref:Luciferase-like, subgroup n=1 Tax=Granulicella mallensis (strain ATCC BAA-1857 / DSM 23137 / MP5ACTX8) TaxID=682795 RepID=G8NU17_GRAMM|nr:LLM class flavin-dependent oxidoreductase [Granulicella mallensis]AEU37573.1 Luciferase-like, subgroup [Granulicella mallensis MP5ACTX8]
MTSGNHNSLRVFTVIPRTPDSLRHTQDSLALAQWSDANSCCGMLLFTGTSTPVEPWVLAQSIIATSKHLEPIIAVNPAHMHPFMVARMITSIAQIYQRKVHLNLIAGTSIGELSALGDTTKHEDRYRRLNEYSEILLSLISSKRPVSSKGDFYQVNKLQLLPAVPQKLMPGLFVAGHSVFAAQIADRIAASRMRMLPVQFDELKGVPAALHFGVVTRDSWNAARDAAIELFPYDDLGPEMLDVSVQNTDATWKRGLHAELKRGESSVPTVPGVWLHPFRMGQSDCPYLVGDREQVADILVNLAQQGNSTFVIETSVNTRELNELAIVMSMVRSRLT